MRAAAQAAKALVPIWIKQPIKQFLIDRGAMRRPGMAGVVDRLTQRAVLARIASRGFAIGTVIDVGASDGHWSEITEQFWPDARYHLALEAQPGCSGGTEAALFE